jgi:arginase
MNRQICILGAPSAIGIRPYDDGTVRRLDLAPAALRAQGLVQRLSARDEGDVIPPPYRELVRPPNRIRNEIDVAEYSRALAARIDKAVGAGEFLLVLGGECSIVLGSLLGFVDRGPLGLVYIDGQSDFYTPENSTTGSAAAMGLALAVGKGRGPLATLRGAGPLVAGEHTVMIGRRDDEDNRDGAGKDALAEFGVLDIDGDALVRMGCAAAAAAALGRVTSPRVAGFWIHLDADAIDPREMPAVDSPVPGGPSIDEIVELIAPLVRHPKALGMELTIYDPGLDPDRACAARLATAMERILRPSQAGGLRS